MRSCISARADLFPAHGGLGPMGELLKGAVPKSVLESEQIYIMHLVARGQWETFWSCARSCIRVRADLYSPHGGLRLMGELEKCLAPALETYFGQTPSFSAVVSSTSSEFYVVGMKYICIFSPLAKVASFGPASSPLARFTTAVILLCQRMSIPFLSVSEWSSRVFCKTT